MNPGCRGWRKRSFFVDRWAPFVGATQAISVNKYTARLVFSPAFFVAAVRA
jgi:hypothetical protein